MHSPALRAIANRGLIVGPAPLLRHQNGARYAMTEGVALTAWGMPAPEFNKAGVVGPAPPLDRIQELAAAFFAAGPNGFGVLVEADAGHPVEAELRAAGWKVIEDEPALVLPTLPGAPPAPKGLEIRRVIDAAGLRDFTAVAAAGFADPTSDIPPPSDDVFEGFGPTVACATDADVAVLVGYAGGRPASSAIVFRVEEIAVLTGVATIPAFRRRGFARALTWAAVAAGAERGCTCATLGGLGASYEMYRGMGFLHVCNHRLYTAPASPAANPPS